MALLLLHRHCTVTICHSRTKDLPGIVRAADIVVAAIGRTAFVQPDWVKPGATVVDVGINRVTDAAEVERLFPPDSPRRAAFAKRGALVVGDVHPGVAEVAGALTPVPGGVGPLTIAMLLHNTLVAAERRVARRWLRYAHSARFQDLTPSGPPDAESGADGRDCDRQVTRARTSGSARRSHYRRGPSRPPGHRARERRRTPRPRAISANHSRARPNHRPRRARRGSCSAIRRRGRISRRSSTPSCMAPSSVGSPRFLPGRVPASPTFRCSSKRATRRISTSWSSPPVRPDEQVRRLVARDGLAHADALARIATQWPITEKVARAGVVIDTNGSIEDTEPSGRRAARGVVSLRLPHRGQRSSAPR